MPFEQKYDTATREAAVERVLQRRATHPSDRHVFTVVANEFNVGQQSLRAWVEAAEPEAPRTGRKGRRPRFSPVVTSKIERDAEAVEVPAEGTDQAPVDGVTEREDMWFDDDVAASASVEPSDPETTAPAADPEPSTPTAEIDVAEAETPDIAETSTRDVAALEAEIAALRRRNAALKAAMRILLAD